MSRQAKRVLIVEDNPVVQEVLDQFLRPTYHVTVTSNGSQALGALAKHPPDVMLLDVRIPGVDGLSLLRSLRDMGITIPIFVITGYDSTEVAEEAMSNGANGYLPKPFDLLYLERLIARAVDTNPALT
ncbi:MAG TPA: response regulator [Methylomirabilota bacterium]|jgi:CheY-like chemotaxis protein|nr:response regulator [Methylomirabilota bacterium]